jgi:tRNA-guanine family transglycosylase
LKHLVEIVGPKRIVPVVHGTTIGEVESNCDLITGISGSPAMVCVGGMVPLLRRSGRPSVGRDRAMAWLTAVLSATRAFFPRAVIHLLGAGAPQSVAMAIACGADSTDSIAWRRAAGFGTIYLPGTGERFLAPRDRYRANSRPMLNASEREQLAACCCPACREFPVFEERTRVLQACYLARAAHNARIVLSGIERSFL